MLSSTPAAIFAHYPSLVVELGAVFVLAAALVSRVVLKRFGIPSIVTLLAFGLLAGPSGINFLRLDLTNPATRALLSLAVVIVLFEATLRMNLRGIPKSTMAILALCGTVLPLLVLPFVVKAYGFSRLLASMTAAVCVVTGPTVVGPLMSRLRPRAAVSHLLESEGLVLDSLGVLLAAATFATFTSRPGPLVFAYLHVAGFVGAGVAIGVAWGFLGKAIIHIAARTSSDISKVAVLLQGFGAYATAEWLAHESGLVAVVVCGLLIDFRTLPHERPLRAFKEDLSMLALSTVFVLLASQIRVESLLPLVPPAIAVVAALIIIRIVSVLLGTLRSPFNVRERLLMAAVFPRGIVAVSLATYYATQISAWGMHGGNRLAGMLFLIVVFTIVSSTPLAIVAATRLGLQMPSVVIAGVTPTTLEIARHYKESGHLPLLVDTNEEAVAFARSHDIEAIAVATHTSLPELVKERHATVLVLEPHSPWQDADLHQLRDDVTILDSDEATSTALA